MSQAKPTVQWTVVSVAVAAAAIGVGVAAWAAPSATQPTTGPASQPAADAGRRDGRARHDHRDRQPSGPTAVAVAPAAIDTTPKPMSSKFDVVRSRSIFVRGYQGIGRNPDRPTDRPFSQPTPSRPEESLVLRGVTIEGDEADALVEDTSANKVLTVGVGGAIATGKVTAISFDSLDYQARGHTTHVGLGQTLDGTAAAPTTAPAAAVTFTTGNPGGAAPPANGTAAPVAPPPPSIGKTAGLSADDLLARMKKRREEEMNKK